MHLETRPSGFHTYLANRLGHGFARTFVRAMANRPAVKAFLRTQPDAAKMISEGAFAATQVFEVGGSHPLAKFLNMVAETVAAEASDLIEDAKAHPGDRHVEQNLVDKIEEAADRVESRKVFVAFRQSHASRNCSTIVETVQATTPSPSVDKNGKSHARASSLLIIEMELEDAQVAGYMPCPYCFPDAFSPKAQEASEETEQPLLQYLARFQQESVEKGTDAFQKFWEAYVLRVQAEGGEKVAELFSQAFSRYRAGYPEFLFVARLPSDQWELALRTEVKNPGSLAEKAEKFVEKEIKETSDMFEKVFAAADRWNGCMRRMSAGDEAEIEDLKRRAGKLVAKRASAPENAGLAWRKIKTWILIILILTAIALGAAVIYTHS